MHTPGPWVVRRAKFQVDGAYDYGIGAMIDGHERCLAEAFGRVAEDVYQDAEANARLIAAAPCLLAALESLIAIADESEGVAGYHLNGAVASWGSLSAVAEARAAIAKAKGGS
ncbi:MAG: hypothetical protein KIT18_15760 [Burkholderiales bacterium]|nr:hypothetical protein [Burkholderiales bacterium]